MPANQSYKPDKPPKPWERQENEPEGAFAAFQIYRDMPAKERSIRLVAEKQNTVARFIQTWSSKWNWVERVAKYTVYLDEQKRELVLQEMEEMSKMHIKAAKAMLAKALMALKAIQPEQMTATEITRMIEVSTKLERLTRGESTENTEIRAVDGIMPSVQIYLPDNKRKSKK